MDHGDVLVEHFRQLSASANGHSLRGANPVHVHEGFGTLATPLWLVNLGGRGLWLLHARMGGKGIPSRVCLEQNCGVLLSITSVHSGVYAHIIYHDGNRHFNKIHRFLQALDGTCRWLIPHMQNAAAKSMVGVGIARAHA